jgi:hypothetical protein
VAAREHQYHSRATVIAAALAATGTVSELLPGVELGRISLRRPRPSCAAATGSRCWASSG